MEVKCSLDEPVSADLDALSVIAQENMFDTIELCLFDLGKIRDVLRHFILDEDLEETLKQKGASLLSYISKIIVEAHA